MNKTKQYILQMNIHLNPYIQKFTEKWIKPLLLDSECSQIMPNLRQWRFEQTPNPRVEEWPRLAQHKITEDSEEKREREIIPINGKIKLNNNIISLELLLKFVAIRTDVTDQEIDNNKQYWKSQRISGEMVLIAATDQQTTEEAYYRSVQELGQCHKEKLSNRTGAMFLEMGINLQDIRIKIGMETNLRIIRNERQYLTYIPDKI